MKIIRPVKIDDFDSIAPVDGFLRWSPVGRDFLSPSNLVSHSIDNTNGLAYFLDSNGKIEEVDLETGAISQLVATFPGAYQVAVMPTGGFVAVCWNNSSNDTEIRVVRLSDQQIVYVYTDQSPDQYVHFSHDGLRMLRTSGTQRLIAVSTSTWSTTQVLPNMEEVHQGLSSTTLDYAAFFHSNQWSVSPYGDGPYVAVAYRATYTDQFQTQRRSGVARINYETGAFVGYTDTTASNNVYTKLIHNAARSEVLVYAGSASPISFDDSTFTSGGLAPDLPMYSESAVRSPDNSEILVRSLSTSPAWRRFAMVDYAERGQLDPALPSKAAGAVYSASFYVLRLNEGGYALIDRLNDSLITQTNPTVTAGDIYTYSDSNYEALTDNNDRPDLGAALEVPTWLNLGAINPLRMFDGKLDTLTTAPSPLTVSITPGQLANGIALFNVTAQTVQIAMTDPVEGQVYDSGEIQMLDNASIRDWYSFFFEPYLRKSDVARIDLPPYPDATITVTLSADGDSVSIGQLVLGTIQRFGETVYGTSVGITDFSRKEADTFGNYLIVERRFSKRAEYDVSIDTRAVASVQRTLATYRAKPVVWVGAVEQEETIVYGYYRDFDIVLDNYSTSDATITVEGL